MPPWGPISRRQFIQALREAGFDGPFSGGKHQFMRRGQLSLRIPNPHLQDIGLELLIRILRQAGISKETWISLD
jgi:predicted RNA binding protein YcfA (HicA-like mRNA interferase family)